MFRTHYRKCTFYIIYNIIYYIYKSISPVWRLPQSGTGYTQIMAEYNTVVIRMHMAWWCFPSVKSWHCLSTKSVRFIYYYFPEKTAHKWTVSIEFCWHGWGVGLETLSALCCNCCCSRAEELHYVWQRGSVHQLITSLVSTSRPLHQDKTWNQIQRKWAKCVCYHWQKSQHHCIKRIVFEELFRWDKVAS